MFYVSLTGTTRYPPTFQKRNEYPKQGHSDCHSYRTLDPRRPVYDELAIHPPPRRLPVPGEEVSQSGASLYAGIRTDLKPADWTVTFPFLRSMANCFLLDY